jgi:hypothetical protein
VQSEDKAGEPTVYTLVFRAANPLPRDSSIIINYPPRVKPIDVDGKLEVCEIGL